MSLLLRIFPFMLMLISHAVSAGGVTVGGTRLIYDGSKKEASLNITSTDNAPYLIQSWVEPQDGTTQKAPFIITPPLFKLEANEQNILRVIRIGGNLPEDRESLFWLSVKVIPSSDNDSSANTLQVAVRTRIKLIYRPGSLKGIPEDMADKLTWSRSGNKLTVNNPTPFIMNFQSVSIGGQNVKNPTWVMPYEKATYTAPESASGQVSWSIISDFGGVGNKHHE